MDLTPNEDEQQLADMTARFLKGKFPRTRLHAEDKGRFSDAIRRSFAEQGWFGLGIPENLGGVGFSIVDEMLLFREGGRELAPLGLLASNLAAKLAAASHADLANAIISGETGAALALDSLNRSESRLLDAKGAPFAVRLSPVALTLVSLEGIGQTPAECLDKSVSQSFADLRKAKILATSNGERFSRDARLLIAATMVGIAEAVTEMTVEYAKIRETFGRPIGSYQAVRHPCAEMAVRTFAARAELFFAAVAIRDGRPDASLHTDAALALAREAAINNCDWSIQLHGGIATTDEHNAHLYLKRAHLLGQLFGTRGILERVLDSAPLAA